jgi:hypothetical protein
MNNSSIPFVSETLASNNLSKGNDPSSFNLSTAIKNRFFLGLNAYSKGDQFKKSLGFRFDKIKHNI